MFSAAAFLGSFLAFSLELITAKALLPLFGGGAFVWTTALMFFQAALLAGYLYCRFILARFELRRYAKAHFVLLLLALLFPLSPALDHRAAHPVLSLLWSLLRSIGPSFFLLSTTAILMQNWIQRRNNFSGGAYFIYAASNAGALAALIAYPLLLEPWLSADRQLFFWRALYAGCAALHLLCLPPRGLQPAAANPVPASPGRRLLWLTLSAASSAALLAATNYLAQNLASVPLLWIVPLAVYLATFILNFKRDPWKPGRLYPAFAVLIALFLVPASVAFLPSRVVSGRSVLLLMQLISLIGFALNLAALAIVCMLAHKSLAEIRPQDEAAMPDFYASLALGGWLGSLLIAVALPLLARGLGFVGLDWIAAGILTLAGIVLRDGFPATALRRAGAAAALAPALLLIVLQIRHPGSDAVYALRNFYGIYRVRQTGDLRKFFHGNTLHGMQYTDRFLRPFPIGYYHPQSPFGRMFEAFGGSFKDIGVVGLGIGSIAAYGRAGQAIDFYELDPDVEPIARNYFRHLDDSKARVRVLAGDARLSLSREGQASYDLLVLDAFSSDAVPVHLLTQEAFAVYLARLKPGGLLACHISSRFLDLKPVLAAAAGPLSLHGASKASAVQELAENEIPSRWVVLSSDAAKIERLAEELGWTDLKKSARGIRPWTDQHASLWPALGF